MDEYIERKAVIEFIRSYRHSTDVAFHMEEHLNEIPAADVRPVVRGRWINDGGNKACSKCRKIWLYRKTNYCPNCGAKMEES